MSSYGYNVISYSLLRTLRFVHVVVSLHNVTPDYTFSFIFENLVTFLFLFSFRLVKVAKRETEIRGRGGERGRNSFFFFSQRVDKEDVRLDNFLSWCSSPILLIYGAVNKRDFSSLFPRDDAFSHLEEKEGGFFGGEKGEIH